MQSKLKSGYQNDDEATPDKAKKQLTHDDRAEAVNHGHALYRSSNVADRRNKGAEEYWYERNAEECTFKPDLAKGDGKLSSRKPLGSAPGSAYDVRGSDKAIERMNRAREEAAFGKKMSERSSWSPMKKDYKAKLRAGKRYTASESRSRSRNKMTGFNLSTKPTVPRKHINLQQ